MLGGKMGLLADIQASLLNEQPIGPILLKLRFLAARLGSATLEDWVKYEAEGYPPKAAVPDYRRLGVSYRGNFNGPFGRTASNIPIPPYHIVEHAGEGWLTHDERQSVSTLEDLIASAAKAGTNLEINAANLVLLLRDKVFTGMACHSVHAIISRAAVVGIIGALRTRVLELTLEIERKIPGASEIAAGQASQPSEPEQAAVVTHITNQIINGAVGSNVANSGAGARFNIVVGQGDATSMVRALKEGGIADADAEEFAKLVASEKPESSDEPFGTKAKAWIAANIGKALNGTWGIGVTVATTLLAEVAKRYYGLG
jgi:hypothetical protein